VASRANLSLPTGRFLAGQSIPSGTIVDAGTGRPLAISKLSISTDSAAPVTVTADHEGRFPVLEPVNRTSSPRRILVSVTYEGNATYPSVEAQSQIFIQSLVKVIANVSDLLVMGKEVVAKVDVDTFGQEPVSEGILSVVIGERKLGTTVVRDGTARIPITVPDMEEPGDRVLQFRYEGTDSYGPKVVEVPVRLVHQVILKVDSNRAMAGDVGEVRVTVTGGGKPVPLAPVYLQIEGTDGGITAVTDATGVATFQILQPNGTTLVAARFAGTGDLTPAHSVAVMEPAVPLTFVEHATRSLPWAGIVIAAVLAALTPLLYKLRRSPLEPIMRRLRRILLARGPDAEQILLAFADLEEAAIGAGLLTEMAPTAGGLQDAVAPHVPAAARNSLARLTELFDLARYSREDVGPPHREAAVEALNDILQSIRRESHLWWHSSVSPSAQGGTA